MAGLLLIVIVFVILNFGLLWDYLPYIEVLADRFTLYCVKCITLVILLGASVKTFILRSLLCNSLIFFPLPHLETLYLGTVWVFYVLLMLLWLWCLYILSHIWNISAKNSSDSVTFLHSLFFSRTQFFQVSYNGAP